MEIVLLCARLLLAVVFGVAGIAKILDAEGSRRAMVGFGLPEGIAGLVGTGLPVVELLIAVSLIPLSSAWLGAVGAGGLLLAFIVAIAVNLARGRTPDCHCFGQLHSEPVGWSTMVRNVVLMAIAGLIVAQGKSKVGMSALGWLDDLKVGEIIGIALGVVSVSLLAVTFAYLRRVLNQHTMLVGKIDAMKKVIDEDYAEAPVERIEAAGPAEGLPIGAPAPEFSLTAIGGAQVQLKDLLAHGKSLLLLFVSPTCGPCKSLLPAAEEWERNHNNKLTVALLSKGDAELNKEWLAESGITHRLLQDESRIAEEYEAKWTPAAVMVRTDGRIGSSLVYGDEAIRELVNRSLDSAGQKRGRVLEVRGNGHKPQVIIGKPNSLRDLGKQAPHFSLFDLEEEAVTVYDFGGRDTLLLFWDPKCPFCQAMSEDIAKLEAEPLSRTPRLVFVSQGDRDAVKAEAARFNSKFLHDPELQVALMFGTNLTPSAVLIDARGRIASPPTAGRAQILSLAGVRKSTGPVASIHAADERAMTR